MNNLGNQIKLLRQESGLTQADLAKKIEIDVTYLSKIENNKVESIPEDLAKRFALFFEMDPIEFTYMAGEIPEEHKKIILNNSNIQKEITLKFRIAQSANKQVKSVFYTPDAIESKANELIRKWARKNNKAIVLPPIPIREIIEDYEEEIKICELKTKEEIKKYNIPDNAMGAASTNLNIFLNFYSFKDRFNSSQGSLRFTIAHELGHCILHFPSKTQNNQLTLFNEQENEMPIYKCRSQDILGENENADWDEINANRFASCILMPKDLVSLYWNQCEEVNELANTFQVSNQAMTFRLKKLGLL